MVRRGTLRARVRNLAPVYASVVSRAWSGRVRSVLDWHAQPGTSIRLAGILTLVGDYGRRLYIRPTGSITPTGRLTHPWTVALSGETVPSGAVQGPSSFAEAVDGAIEPVGAHLGRVKQRLAGAVEPTGSLALGSGQLLGGVLAPAGALRQGVAIALAGGITPEGEFLRPNMGQAVSGGITPAGEAITIGPVDKVGGTQTSFSVEWYARPAMSGRVEYDTDPGFGSSLLTNKQVEPLDYHLQFIGLNNPPGAPALTPGQTYYCRIVESTTAGGTTVMSGSYAFVAAFDQVAVGGGITPLGAVTRRKLGPIKTVAVSGGITPAGAVATQVISPSPVSAIFGIGCQGYNKNNMLVKRPGAKAGHGEHVAVRFLCTHSGVAKYLRFQWKNRSPDYGQGDGGRYRVGIQATTGAGMPVNTSWLDSTTWEPGINNYYDGTCVQLTLPGAASLVAGTTYALVFANIHTDPVNNYSSTNQPSSHGHYVPTPFIHGAWPDDETMVLGYGPSTWTEMQHFYPAFDVEYTNGGHDGFSSVTGSDGPGPNTYDEAVDGNVWGDLNSGSICRFAFTYPTGQPTITVDAFRAFMRKLSGSTNATLVVKKNSATVATGTFTTSGAMSVDAREWCRAALSSQLTIAAGDYIEAIISVTAGSYHLPGNLFHGNTCLASDAMGSSPYDMASGNQTQPFRSYDGASGTNPVWYSSWAAHSSFSCYYEIVT